MRGEKWSRDETLLAMRLYCPTAYGRIHRRNPEIVELANLLKRTPDSVARKMLNLASFDPVITSSGRKGLTHASKLDKEIWDTFGSRIDQLLWASDEALKRVYAEIAARGEELLPPASETLKYFRQFSGPTATTREQPQRLAQGFFRRTVLASYDYRCAVSGIEKEELLTASHIIPWSKEPNRRSDPMNGLSLSTLHDRAFDRGLISFDENNSLLVSDRLKVGKPNSVLSVAVLELEGKCLEISKKFPPDPVALAYHRERIFKAS